MSHKCLLTILVVSEAELLDLLSTQEAPPLMPALTSSRYHIKWTQLADLPVPLYDAYVAVQHHKIYVTGGDSPVQDAVHNVYVYDINTDQWGQLPPSGHYKGTPHIIGGRLAIIGGRLSVIRRELIKYPLLMKTAKLGHLTILTYSQLEVDLG